MPFDLIRENLQKELEMLSLHEPILSDRSQVETILSKTYKSKSRILRLLGYWSIRQIMSREEMVKNGHSVRSIRYCENLLTEAGISINGNIDRKELPALSNFLTLQTKSSQVQILSQTPSDTRRNILIQGGNHVKETWSRGSIYRRKDGLCIAQISVQGKRGSFESNTKSAIEQAEGWEELGHRWSRRDMFLKSNNNTD